MRNIWTLCFCFFMHTLLYSQVPDYTLGLRFGAAVSAWGAEGSYQIGVSDNTRCELDLGYGQHEGLTVIKGVAEFHWIGNLGGDFNWYGGPVLAGGMYKQEKDFKDAERFKSFISVGVDLGIDYYFYKLPLQLAIDFRPEFPLGDSYTNGDFDNGFGLALRYIIEW